MNSRKELIQHCCYPFLPEKSISIWSLYFFGRERHKDFVWLGGCLTRDISIDFFSLHSQFRTVKCFVSASCSLFFDFSEKAERISWKKVFSLLRAGDHLLIGVQNAEWRKNVQAGGVASGSQTSSPYIQENAQVERVEIRNIKKIILMSVNKKNQALSVSSDRVQYQNAWFDFLDWVHEGMKCIGLQKVATPTLVDCPGTEPDLNVFETCFYPGFLRKTNKTTSEENKSERKGNKTKQVRGELRKEGQSKKLFLCTSPEMYMKRLLCHGWTDIYEIKKCFRNSERGPLNHTEFYLLEWYRAYSDLDTLIEDMQFLLNFLSKKTEAASFPQLKKMSMKELFKQHLGMNLHPHSSKKDFICELEKRNIPFDKADEVDDLFYLLFLNTIEPDLDSETPLIIYDYPPFQKAYARIGPEGWASRFELFWKGMELANAFDEVMDSKEQGLRFQEDRLKRRRRKKQDVPPSYGLLEDMQAGMPPASGVALGLERLFLAFKNLNDISFVKVDFFD